MPLRWPHLAVRNQPLHGLCWPSAIVQEPGYHPAMIARPTRSDWLLLLVLGIMWGTSYAFIKLGVETLPTFTLIATRLLIGVVLLWTVVGLARESLP